MKRILAYSVLLFWAVMVGWFIEREVIPTLYQTTGHGYEALRTYARATPGYRMGIYAANGSRIGHTETRYNFTRSGDCEIVSNATIDLKRHSLFALGGADAPGAFGVTIQSEVTVGPDNALKAFRVNYDSGGLSGLATGLVQGNVLRMTLLIGGQRNEREISVTRDDVMSSGFLAVGALPKLSVGQSWRIRMLNPLNFQFDSATARVVRQETIRLRGHAYTAYRVELDRGVTVGTAWVNAAGDVLKEETFGLVMVREPLPHEGDYLPEEAQLTTAPAAEEP
jgi:hypothetical protein